jgi:ABC-type amino acid transport substrate-binding protein
MLQRSIGVAVILVALFFFAWGYVTPSGQRPWVVARDTSWAPSDVGSKGTNLIAFSDDLLMDTAKDLGVRIRFVSSDAKSVGKSIAEGTVDAFVGVVPPTSQNLASYDFSKSFFYLGPVLVVPATSIASSLDDLAGTAVGVDRRYPGTISLLRDKAGSIRAYDDVVAAFEGMLAGEVSGVIGSGLAARAQARGAYQTRVRIVSANLTDEGLRLVSRKGARIDFSNRFDTYLLEARQSGRYDELVRKWALAQ